MEKFNLLKCLHLQLYTCIFIITKNTISKCSYIIFMKFVTS